MPESAPNELIVGLANLGLVVNKLIDLDVGWSELKSSEPLGLARIVLANEDTAAKLVHNSVFSKPAAKEQVKDHPEPDDSLGKILWGLRGLIAAENAGFMPVMGRNRIVTRVHEVGKVWHGGDDDPVAASVRNGSPLLTPRAAGPGRGVRVGVLDTVLFPHPWLAGGWTARFSDTITDDSALLAAQGHATFVTGLVLSQAPGAAVQVRAVLTEDGSGDSWQIAEAIVDLGNSGIDVLNLSFQCYTDDNQPPLVLAAAVDRIAPTVVVVAAAGNHGDLTRAEDPTGVNRRRPSWPAAIDDVIAVGASNSRDERAKFSPDAPWVDILAPGDKVLSTFVPKAEVMHKATPSARKYTLAKLPFRGSFARWSGTSFSAALMSGAIAAGTEPGRITSQQALQNILSTVRPSPAPNSRTVAIKRPKTVTKPPLKTTPPIVKLRSF